MTETSNEGGRAGISQVQLAREVSLCGAIMMVARLHLWHGRLRRHCDRRGQKVPEAAKKIGVTEQTYYRWKKEYGGLRHRREAHSARTRGL